MIAFLAFGNHKHRRALQGRGEVGTRGNGISTRFLAWERVPTPSGT